MAALRTADNLRQYKRRFSLIVVLGWRRDTGFWFKSELG